MNGWVVRAFLLAALLLWAPPHARAARDPLSQSFDEWKAACAKLPSNRSLKGRMPPAELLPLPQFHDFDVVLSAFLEQAKTGPLAETNNWVGRCPVPGFFDTKHAYFLKSPPEIPFQPFAAKVIVPTNSELFFHADFHGDLHSLLADLTWLNNEKYLNSFTIARTNFYMIFLGDYTDRGSYGIEVLYTLFRLQVANPGRVFLARGNHEEVSLQSRYGFLQEATAKYGAALNAQKMMRAYDFLPVAIYVGTGIDFIQCNHGGMEPGYNPRTLISSVGDMRFQLLGALNQQQFLTENPQWMAAADSSAQNTARRSLRDFVPEDPISPSVLGLMWNDYSVLASDPEFAIDPGRAYVYGQRATQFLLRNASTPINKLRAVFRGHQQSSALNPMMRRLIAGKGVFRHWQEKDSPARLNASPAELGPFIEHEEVRPIPTGSVWTFNVSPDSIYGENCGYAFDAIGILKVAASFDDWRLRVVNLPAAPP